MKHLTSKVLPLILFVCVSGSTARAQGLKLQTRWALLPGDRTYLTTGTNQRGLAFNPVTGHLILVNRSGGISVHLLDALTGDDLGVMDTTSVTNAGTFLLSKVDVADDGVIYAANFGTIGTATPAFTVYRWDGEASVAGIAYAGDPGAGNIQQWGTTFDVRGQGASTEILVTSSTGTIGALLTTADGTSFTAQVFQTDVSPGQMGIAVAFGTNNTFWAKSVDGPLLHLNLDTNTWTASVLHQFSVTNFPGTTGPLMVEVTSNLLAGINVTSPDTVDLFSIANLTAPPVLLNSTALPTDVPNSLFMGTVQFAPGMVFALDSNNGLAAYDLVANSDPVPPYMILHPRETTVFVGQTVTFASSATGSAPLYYQWQTNWIDVPNATNSILVITNVQAGHEADYAVVVTNVGGTVMSFSAHLTVLPPGIMTPIWSLAPGSRSYLTGTGNNQRGMSYNPATGHLVLANMAGGASVNLLDARTGADAGTMNVTGISTNSGTFKLLMIGVADDGVIYGANFGSYPGTVTTIYRWANEGATWTYAFKGDPSSGRANLQWGNTLDVRGAGTNTQILLPSGGQAYICVMTTADGVNFVPNLISNIPAGAVLQGAAFGEGNTFWGKSDAGATLVHIGYDLLTGDTNSLEWWDSSLFPASVKPIMLDTAHNLLAGVSIATPDTVDLYDISHLSPTEGPVLLQSVKVPTDNANTLFRGALDFGDEKLFALDTNNGLMAFALPYLRVNLVNTNVVVSWQATLTGFALEAKSSVTSGTWTPVGGATITNGRYTVSLPVGTGAQYFRLRK